MKKLFLMRHAKSSWDHPQLSDFQRPLNKRGKKAAPLIGAEARARGFIPEIVFCSSAVRARETYALFSGSVSFGCETVYEERIYGAGPDSLLYLIAEIEDIYESALLVGHNPGFETLQEMLTGSSRRMPTAAFSAIDLKCVGWSDIEPGCGELADFFVPKELAD